MKTYYSEASSSSVLTVTELNKYVRDLLEDDIGLQRCELEGEISNFKHYLTTGHMYFTLKDDESSISAVMYRSSNENLTFLPKDGMKVTVKGAVSIYSQSGKYQIYIREMKKAGEGNLFLKFEKLKKQLSAEGLFDEEYKKPLPRYPMNVGVITSKFGAALQDIINISKRRFPLARVYVYPSLVQGDGAAENICRGIDYFENNQKIEVLIIGRGGGSIEDLWAFNDEKLARRIFKSNIPIVSAVGHETDFSISDFVADLRAPTPSAAAELVFPDMSEINSTLIDMRDRMTEEIEDKIADAEMHLSEFSAKKISEKLLYKVNNISEKLSELDLAMKKTVNFKISTLADSLTATEMLLDAASPLKILTKGYSLVSDFGGNTVRDADSINVGDDIYIRFSSGTAKAKIKEKRSI